MQDLWPVRALQGRWAPEAAGRDQVGAWPQEVGTSFWASEDWPEGGEIRELDTYVKRLNVKHAYNMDACR